MSNNNDNEDIKFPSLIEQGKNFIKSAGEVVKDASKGKSIFVPKDVQDARLKKCKKCDWYYNSPISKYGKCMACGCPVLNKTAYASSICPKEKWDKWEK